MNKVLVTWQAVTPVHVGTSQDGGGVVDLPVAREVPTGYPWLPSSGMKGVLTRTVKDTVRREILFGAAASGPDQPGHGGDITLFDAKILALPVASLWGTFALVSCASVITRLSRDFALLGFGEVPLPPTSKNAESLLVPNGTSIVRPDGDIVLLDDFILNAESVDLAGLIAWFAGGDDGLRETLTRHLCLVPDDVFSFLARYGLPVTAHNSIDEKTGTVKPGALFYEEDLPEETLLMEPLSGTTHDPAGIIHKDDVLQVGGKAGVGRGFLRAAAVIAAGLPAQGEAER